MSFAPRRPPRGGVMIEFALVLPIFVLLLLGAMDWGWYFMIRETATNAAREGARVGAVSPSVAASDNAVTAVRSYLQNALGDSYRPEQDVTLFVDSAACAVGTSQCISVTLRDYPVVAGRPTSSITGLNGWTRAPTTLSITATMRLEAP
jgi:Flp pilus assembly protein TadG